MKRAQRVASSRDRQPHKRDSKWALHFSLIYIFGVEWVSGNSNTRNDSTDLATRWGVHRRLIYCLRSVWKIGELFLSRPCRQFTGRSSPSPILCSFIFVAVGVGICTVGMHFACGLREYLAFRRKKGLKTFSESTRQIVSHRTRFVDARLARCRYTLVRAKSVLSS